MQFVVASSQRVWFS